MLATSGRDKSERDIAMKLHRQFCHPSSEKLIKLVKNSRVKNKKKIEKEINDALHVLNLEGELLGLLYAFQWQQHSMKL